MAENLKCQNPDSLEILKGLESLVQQSDAIYGAGCQAQMGTFFPTQETCFTRVSWTLPLLPKATAGTVMTELWAAAAQLSRLLVSSCPIYTQDLC